MKLTLSILVFSLGTTVSFCQKPGTIDTKFGDNGFVIPSNKTDISVKASIVFKNDKIFTISNQIGAQPFSRYLPDGTPDSSFGKNGTLNSTDIALAPQYITIQKDNKVVIAGISTVASVTVISVTRLKDDGTVDSTFGVNGSFRDSSEKSDYPAGIIALPDDKLVICGNVSLDQIGEALPLVMRLTADGKIDPKFGNNGKTVARSEFFARSLTQQPDGKIVCAGSSETFTISSLLRFNADGSVDSSFGQNGLVLTDFDEFVDTYYNVCAQPDGKILAEGEALVDSRNDNYLPYISLARYNADGTLDNTFGNGGKVKAFENIYATGSGLALQKNGKPVICSSVGDKDAFSFGIARFTKEGLVDSMFGTDGETVTDINSGSADMALFVDLQSDGKIILIGNTSNVNGLELKTVLTRYYGDQIKQQSPIVKKIKRWIRNPHT